MFQLFRRKPFPAEPSTPPVPELAPDPFPATATEADILACFRLLLGRPPNPEEWRGHSSHAGAPLDTIVSLYLTSREFAQRGMMKPAIDPRVRLIECDGFLLYIDEQDVAVGLQVMRGSFEPDVTKVFRQRLKPGMSVIDIGANIGYFAMLSASLVGVGGHVLAVEPNPRNARMLEASRRANGFDQISVCQTAAGRALDLLVLNTTHSNGTTSAANGAVEHLLDAETVACLPLDSLVARERRVDFIKVDVEGAEYNALLGCKGIVERDHPMIVSEFSPGMMGSISNISGPDYLRWLTGCGYNLNVIQPDGSLQAANTVQDVMDLYIARNVDHIDLLALAV